MKGDSKWLHIILIYIFHFLFEIAGIHFIILHATKSYPFQFKRNVHKKYNRFPFFRVCLPIDSSRKGGEGNIFFYKMSFIWWYDKGGNISTSNCPLELLFSLSCCITTAVHHHRPSCTRISSWWMSYAECWWRWLVNLVRQTCALLVYPMSNQLYRSLTL